ncbi:MAG: FAD-dependent oxidoreductase [Chloroflexi bacterium]|nr:FAD-dependent oxidoreductase [Chloroflexota bacterium]
MAKLVFSSWGNEIIDNRNVPADQRTEANQPSILLDFDPSSQVAAFMGWNGFIVLDETANVIDMARAYAEAASQVTCNRCTSCRIGGAVLAQILNRILDGDGEEEDLTNLEYVGETMKRNSMCTLGETAAIPVLDTVKHYRQAYLDLIRNREPVERGEYKIAYTAPCAAACPAHLDIPGYVEHIKHRRDQDCLDVVREGVCLPGVIGRVCVHPCEEACRRGKLDYPISICRLKRFAADDEVSRGYWPKLPGVDPAKPKAAIIGGGPAGLSCAWNLALMGYPTTIFEALPVAGGMAAVGIPPYRLPKDVLQHEVDIVKSAGVEIVLNTRIGKDLLVQDLWDRGYKAIFVGIGAHSSSKMGVEGEDAGYEGFWPGVEFLRELNLNRPVPNKGKVVIVGGGNVAMDCARSSLRLGFDQVHLVYRRSRAEMPANPEEIEDAEHEGVVFHFLTNPTRLIAKDGKVVGLELIKMELGEPDASGRRRPIPVKGSEYIMDVDVVIPAIGQVIDFSPLEGVLEPTRRGTVPVKRGSHQTSNEAIFAGGDCVTGPTTLIEALSAGNQAAYAIDRYLRGEPADRPDDYKGQDLVRCVGPYTTLEEGGDGRGRPGLHHLEVERYEPDEDVGVEAQRPRQAMPVLPVEERVKSFAEVELGFPPETAVREAERCLRCYRLALVAVKPAPVEAEKREAVKV